MAQAGRELTVSAIILFFIAAVLYTLTREIDAMERQQKTEDVWNHIDSVRDNLNDSIDRLYTHTDGTKTEIERGIDDRFNHLEVSMEMQHTALQSQIDQINDRLG